MDDLKILPKELKKKLDSNEDLILLDVRTTKEYEITHIKNSKLIPIDQLKERLNELPKDKEIVTYCHHGVRGMEAAKMLKANGFKKVKSLVGGLDVWSRFIDQKIKIY